MARVAVVHNTLDFQGGADIVCLTVCAALQGVHDVTLYTLSETDPRVLAGRFDIDLDDGALTVRTPTGAVTAARARGVSASLRGISVRAPATRPTTMATTRRVTKPVRAKVNAAVLAVSEPLR